MRKELLVKVLAFAMSLLSFCSGLVACSTEASDTTNSAELGYNVDCDYSIQSYDGKHYIVFENESTYSSGEESQLASVLFPSFEDFINALTKGILEDWQKKVIATAFPRDEFGILVCDIDNLYTPVMPKNSVVTNVGWAGPSYSFVLEIDDVFGFIHCLTESQYDYYVYEYTTFFDRDNITVTKTEQLDDNRVATYYNTSEGSLKSVRYTLSDGKKTYTIDKRYRINMHNSELSESSDVPYNVKVYCIESEKRYMIDLYEFGEDPSDEWLLSFGLSKYN